MNDVKIGDVVDLKSGGPNMTVNHIHDNIIHCVWFDDNNNLAEGRFHRDTVNVNE